MLNDKTHRERHFSAQFVINLSKNSILKYGGIGTHAAELRRNSDNQFTYIYWYYTVNFKWKTMGYGPRGLHVHYESQLPFQWSH